MDAGGISGQSMIDDVGRSSKKTTLKVSFALFS